MTELTRVKVEMLFDSLNKWITFGLEHGASSGGAESTRVKLAALKGLALSPLDAREEWNFDMSQAPKDSTPLLLLIDHNDLCDHPLEDTEGHSRTVGHNNLDNDGEDVWRFASWGWCQDHYTEGKGAPVAWQPLPPAPSQGKEES